MQPRRRQERLTERKARSVPPQPGSAKGVMFITVENETGVANLILWADRSRSSAAW